ncbi:hypothetical protein D9M70_514710 [compost metagenome]
MHRIAAARRLVTDDTVQRRRDADRATRVGADRDRHQAGSNRDTRAGGRAARYALDVPRARIARRAVVWIEAEAGKGELAHVDPPDTDHAGLGKCCDDGRVLAGGRVALQNR